MSGQSHNTESLSEPDIGPLHEFLPLEWAGNREIRVALTAVVVSVVVFLAALPFAGEQLGPVAAFVPTYVTALIVCDAVTAALLFGLYRYNGSARILLLATAYVFTTFATTGYALIFPGLYPLPDGLAAGPQSTSALYIFWHGGFPLFLLAYALAKRREDAGFRAVEGREHSPEGSFIIYCIASTLLVVAGFAVFATAGRDHIPIFLSGDRTTSIGRTALVIDWMLCFSALIILLWQRHLRKMDLWVVVVLCVWLCDLGLSAVLNTGRYDLGWYVGRIFGLLAASFLLIVLLFENARNYARMASMAKDLQRVNAVLKRASFLDGLTNIYNRRAFDNYLDRQISISKRYKRPLSLVILDIDNFKSYNDRNGHLAGDDALKAVAHALAACCRRGADLAARYGGEEFAVVLPDTDLDGATVIAEYARKAVIALNIPHDGALSCMTVSAGVATLGWGDSHTASDLISEADARLFHAKRTGRNQTIRALPA